MDIETWQAVVALIAAVLGGGFWQRRTRGERDAASDKVSAEAENARSDSARVLAEAYGLLVDDQRDQIKDLREQIKDIREQLGALRTARDTEVATLRTEIGALRAELAESRTENGRLRDRLVTAEALGERRTPA